MNGSGWKLATRAYTAGANTLHHTQADTTMHLVKRLPTCEEPLGERGVRHESDSHVFAALQEAFIDGLLLQDAALYLQLIKA